MTETTKEFVGIADAHGIESFIATANLQKGTLGMLHLRAMANRHRHALVYKVTLNTNAEAQVQKLLTANKYKEALRVLKVQALAIDITTDCAKSWKLIPNDDLDPYS